MAVLPPGYHLKCNFCEETAGPISSEKEVQAFLDSKENQWMEIRVAGEILHCCSVVHFEWEPRKVVEKLFADKEEEEYSWKVEANRKIQEKYLHRGF